MKTVNRNKTNVASKLNATTDIATNTAITVLAIAGTGIAAPAIGLWTGALAGLSGVVIAGVYTAKTIVTIKENF